ncbi:POU domain, class 5, transcription factor 1.1-like [Discoglossus pictus]
MNNQEAYPVSTGQSQDGSHSLNINNFHGYPNHPPSVYPFTGLRPDYREFGSPSGADNSAQAMAWHPMAAYDPMGANVSPQITSQNKVNSINIKLERESEEEEASDAKYTPAQYAMTTPSYINPWNQNFWPGIPRNATPSNYPLPCPRLAMHGAFQGPNNYSLAANRSPETPRKNESATMEGSHCATKSPPNDSCNNTKNTNLADQDDYPSSENEEVDPVLEKEMKEFVRALKEKRIQLGFTQADVGFILGSLYGKFLSQTTICRFESLQLSYKNMRQLKPTLELWLAHAETTNNPQELLNTDPAVSRTCKRKRRTSIEPAAKAVLENYFARCRKPEIKEIIQLAQELNMEKDVVRVWFCNRRQKGKRQDNMFFSGANAGEVLVAQALSQANGEAYAVPQMGQYQVYTAQFYPVDYHVNEIYHQETNTLKSEMLNPEGQNLTNLL